MVIMVSMTEAAYGYNGGGDRSNAWATYSYNSVVDRSNIWLKW